MFQALPIPGRRSRREPPGQRKGATDSSARIMPEFNQPGGAENTSEERRGSAPTRTGEGKLPIITRSADPVNYTPRRREVEGSAPSAPGRRSRPGLLRRWKRFWQGLLARFRGRKNPLPDGRFTGREVEDGAPGGGKRRRRRRGGRSGPGGPPQGSRGPGGERGAPMRGHQNPAGGGGEGQRDRGWNRGGGGASEGAGGEGAGGGRRRRNRNRNRNRRPGDRPHQDQDRGE